MNEAEDFDQEKHELEMINKVDVWNCKPIELLPISAEVAPSFCRSYENSK